MLFYVLFGFEKAIVNAGNVNDAKRRIQLLCVSEEFELALLFLLSEGYGHRDLLDLFALELPLLLNRQLEVVLHDLLQIV